jgi:hypothetical protein
MSIIEQCQKKASNHGSRNGGWVRLSEPIFYRCYERFLAQASCYKEEQIKKGD